MDNNRFIFGIDPGEKKNGLAILKTDGPNKIKLLAGARPTTQRLAEVIEKFAPSRPIICFEMYRVYNSKLMAHRFSRVQTIESIGVIEYLISKYGLECHKSLAINHKVKSSPITTAYMKAEDLWGEYNSIDADHIRDATRVALYWWKIQGILNGGKRVLTDYDKRVLGLL